MIRIGDTVRINSGDFAGRRGVVQMMYYDPKRTGDSDDIIDVETRQGFSRAYASQVAPLHTLSIGDKIHGLCCDGFDWEVIHVSEDLFSGRFDGDDKMILYDSFWGRCENDDCWCDKCDGDERCPYCGVDKADDDTIAESVSTALDNMLKEMGWVEHIGDMAAGGDEWYFENEDGEMLDYIDVLSIWCDLMDYPTWVVDMVEEWIGYAVGDAQQEQKFQGGMR